MAEPTNSVIQDFAGGKGLMSTFMSQNPHTSAKKTLNDGIQEPQTSSYRCRGNVFWGDKSIEDIKGGSEGDKISGDIVKTGGSRSLEAVLGDSLENVVDGIVGDFKGIALGVDKLDLLCWGI